MTLNEYVSSISEKRIGVIGIGISNIPLIRLLAVSGCDVTACDARGIEQLGMDALNLVNLGVKLRLGDKYLDNLDFDVIFRTPGLMPFDPHLEAARASGCVITSEMEAFFEVCPCRIFAVTGSDGKTTTTTIISELLKASGYTVHLGGNIGHPLLCEAPSMKPDDMVVLELSSFQLHSMKCRPNVAVITNISPNHLDKHKDFEDYVTAKKSIYLGQQEEDVLVLNADDERSAEFAVEAPSAVKWFTMNSCDPALSEVASYRNDPALRSAQNGVFAAEGKLWRIVSGEVEYIMSEDEIVLPGEHNVKNYIAAFTATEGVVSNEICRKVACEFKGVEHRLETVRILHGVTYINDSIGSSPSRTIAGLKAMKKKPVIILGGYDKKIPFDSLGDAVCLLAKNAVVTGSTAGKISAAICASEFYRSACENGFSVRLEPDFEEAVTAASNMADRGDIVLFSPACASFDRFKNFEERGNTFKKLIMELK